MALPEIGHETSIGPDRYKLVRIEKVFDDVVQLEFQRLQGERVKIVRPPARGARKGTDS